MLARNDLEGYVSRNYGRCTRGPDCYHGRDSMGRPNGCLKMGWQGTSCPHWKPVEGPERDAIIASWGRAIRAVP